jgi:predicted nucleotidyltransferase component of viral defense system
MKETYFFKQAELVLRALPFIFDEERLGLKGGTAINYFERNLPRISVDIDLTYLPITNRPEALHDITTILNRLSESLINQIPGALINPNRLEDGTVSTLFLQHNRIQIKIEVNLVLRGTIHPYREMNVCSEGQKIFQIAPKARVLSLSDLFGSKICAALDRQHPRDLFDIKLLLENEGLTDKIRKAFIVYLISHSRPMAELLSPNNKDISSIFENEFKGMTLYPVTLEELQDVRIKIVHMIHNDLTKEERQFILSIKERKPEWGMLGLEGIDRLPAVRWKLHNLERMTTKKHAEAVEKLKECLKL